MLLTDKVSEVLGPAWSSVVLAMLGSAAEPSTWFVHELDPGNVFLVLGPPNSEEKHISINAGTVQQASLLQGMLTIAKLAVDEERDRVLYN